MSVSSDSDFYLPSADELQEAAATVREKQGAALAMRPILIYEVSVLLIL